MADYTDRMLIEYLPPVIKEAREYQYLIEAEQPEIYNLFGEIRRALNNQFIETSDEYGVGRWEKMLKIIPGPADTLDERKLAILLRLAEYRPYTYRMLELIMTDLCGENNFIIDLQPDIYFIEVAVIMRTGSKTNKTGETARKMLNRILPANLSLLSAVITETTPLNIRTVTSAAVKQTFTQVSEKAEKTAEMRIYTGSAAAVYTITTLSEAVPIPRKMFMRNTLTDGVSEAVFEDENGGTEPVYLKRGESE